MHYKDWMEEVARIFEVAGVVVISLGAIYAAARAVLDWPGHHLVFDQVRRTFGRPLILGLEILVAADIIETVTVDRTLESIIGLGILIFARIALSFALDAEVDGMWPWRRAAYEHLVGQADQAEHAAANEQLATGPGA